MIQKYCIYQTHPYAKNNQFKMCNEYYRIMKPAELNLKQPNKSSHNSYSIDAISLEACKEDHDASIRNVNIISEQSELRTFMLVFV